MRFPRILLAVVLVALGMIVPAVTHLHDPAPGTVGMTHYSYVEIVRADQVELAPDGTPVITVHVGDTLTFQNNSHWIHIVGSGDLGALRHHEHTAMTPRTMLEENDSYTTPPWRTPGRYAITCTVHPSMNATVVVLP